MKKIKVIISTFGPLHLTKSAEFLSGLIDVSIIQAWLPRLWNSWILTLASKKVGRDLHKTFRKRLPQSVPMKKNHSVSLPEFYLFGHKLFHIGSPTKYQIKAAKLYGLMSRKYIKDADVFHVRSGSGLAGAIETAHERGMKVIVDHSIAHPAFMDRQLRDEYKKNEAVFDLGMDNPFWKAVLSDCNKADKLLVNSQFVKDTFVAEGYDADKISVILQGVRKDFLKLKQHYRQDKNETLKILFTGGFGFRKGAEYLLKALCRLDEMCVNYTMTVVGDSSSGLPLYERYAPKHVTFINTVPQDELKKYLSDSDVYLFPSLCEGCASSGMEAMAAGLPVIATAESGLPITDGQSGMLVKSKNVEQIVKSLLFIKDNPDISKKIGEIASRVIADNYTWEKYAANVTELYKEVLK